MQSPTRFRCGAIGADERPQAIDWSGWENLEGSTGKPFGMEQLAAAHKWEGTSTRSAVHGSKIGLYSASAPGGCGLSHERRSISPRGVVLFDKNTTARNPSV